eukprot:7495766-Pyramimonas_sp.AAC.1
MASPQTASPPSRGMTSVGRTPATIFLPPSWTFEAIQTHILHHYHHVLIICSSVGCITCVPLLILLLIMFLPRHSHPPPPPVPPHIPPTTLLIPSHLQPPRPSNARCHARQARGELHAARRCTGKEH